MEVLQYYLWDLPDEISNNKNVSHLFSWESWPCWILEMGLIIHSELIIPTLGGISFDFYNLGPVNSKFWEQMEQNAFFSKMSLLKKLYKTGNNYP